MSYLLEYAGDAPARIAAAWRRVWRLRGYPSARRAFLADLRRELTRNWARRFAQACVLPAKLPADVRRLYVHFLHTPGSVARYAALITGLPWSTSAQAKDIWMTPDWEVRQKLGESDWTITCTAHSRGRLAGLAPNPDKVGLVYHGLDLSRLPAPATSATPGGRDGRNQADPVRLLLVSRAVEKKGLDLLLDALARLPADLHWRLTHIGGGVLAGSLHRQADRLGLGARVDWRSPQAHAAVAAPYAQADFFVLPCRIATDGDRDRDGLPNVLMEAQSQALACVSSSQVFELSSNAA